MRGERKVFYGRKLFLCVEMKVIRERFLFDETEEDFLDIKCRVVYSDLPIFLVNTGVNIQR